MTIANARGMSAMQYFMSNTITVVFMVLTVAALVYSVVREIRHHRSGKAMLTEE